MKVRTNAVATEAYARVASRDGKDAKKYGALAHKLPGMILENGLAQATGFLLAKGKSKPEHLDLLEDLNAVLRATEATTAPDGPGLHREIIASDLQETMMLTRRALEASGWLKRYAQGVLHVGATGEPMAADEPAGGGE